MLDYAVIYNRKIFDFLFGRKMKITSVENSTYFTSQNQDLKFDASQKKKKEKKYVDPLANWPLRGLGYTNDIGVAISEIAPTTARLFWVPALMYFGADVYDKYKNKGNKYDPNAQRAFSQAVFQAFASIILPTIFGHIGQSAFSEIDKIKGQKLSTNAKERTLKFIKRHAAENDIFDEVQNEDELVKNFEKKFNSYYKDSKEHYKKRNIFEKIYDKLLANCRKSAIATSDETRLKAFAKDKFVEILHSCQSSELLKENIDKQVFKLKAWKSLGSFTALLLTVKPIDSFVEKIIIKQVVEPQMKRLNDSQDKFINYRLNRQK